MRIEHSVASGELQDIELLVFTNTMVFESVYNKGTLRIILLFEIVLWLHHVQMKEALILHVIYISGTRMIEAGIYGLSRENNLEGIMIGVNPLKPALVDEGAVEKPPGLEGWLRYLWRENINKMWQSHWFKVQGDDLLWATALAA